MPPPKTGMTPMDIESGGTNDNNNNHHHDDIKVIRNNPGFSVLYRWGYTLQTWFRSYFFRSSKHTIIITSSIIIFLVITIMIITMPNSTSLSTGLPVIVEGNALTYFSLGDWVDKGLIIKILLRPK